MTPETAGLLERAVAIGHELRAGPISIALHRELRHLDRLLADRLLLTDMTMLPTGWHLVVGEIRVKLGPGLVGRLASVLAEAALRQPGSGTGPASDPHRDGAA